MSRLQRIRGQEATLRILTVSSIGVVLPLVGSFFKVRDFTWSPDDEITQDGFIGETADDLDHQIHGYGGSFTIDKADRAATDYVKQLSLASVASLAPPIATIMVNYTHRTLGVPREKLIFTEGILKMSTETAGGRKEWVNNAFEWKAKFLLP